MPAPAPKADARLVTAAADQAGRWSHIATILRAGVVPFPNLHRGLAELRPMIRYGTTLGACSRWRPPSPRSGPR